MDKDSKILNQGPKIIISGASGFLGSALTNYFISNKFQVIALVRKLPVEKVEGVRYSILNLNKQVEESVFENAFCFIHCAYIRSDASADSVKNNFEGTGKLLQLCSAYSVKKRIFISSLSANGINNSAYALQKIQTEKLFTGPHDLILRPGLVLGNGGLVRSMIEQLKNHRFIPLLNGGKQKIQTVYINDLVEVINECIQKNTTGTLSVAEKQPVLFSDFIRSLNRKLKTSCIFIPTPYWIIAMGLSLLKSIGIRSAINKDNLMGLKNATPCDLNADLNRITTPIRSFDKSLTALIS